MAIYAIGDIQGCFEPLQALLERIGFQPTRAQLWVVGDLVTRGPRSLECLRLARDLGDSARVVLGNHDLHLLAVAQGVTAPRPKDTLEAVLAAADCAELVEWLRNRPLLHHEHGYTLVHAGIAPQWDLATATSRARELERVLRGPHYQEYLTHMYGNTPPAWSEHLQGWDRLRYITNVFTRMRYCRRDGSLALEAKDPPGTQPAELIPWYAVPWRETRELSIIIGHWGTLQLVEPLDPAHNVYHLETGCAFGARLTAMRLEDRAYFSVPCPDTGRRSHWRPAPGHDPKTEE